MKGSRVNDEKVLRELTAMVSSDDKRKEGGETRGKEKDTAKNEIEKEEDILRKESSGNGIEFFPFSQPILRELITSIGRQLHPVQRQTHTLWIRL